ncbi:MAG: LysE family transporter [Armatimonadetes bacterium]|nr:LysE family transporter [Armatimonadota bacterium]
MIALTGAITPGPVLALVIGQVLVQGAMAAAFILVGHALIEIVLVSALALGAAAFLRGERVRGVISVVGGAVLIFMGQDMVRHAGAMTAAGAQADAMPWYGLVLAGVGVSLSNPYFTGWWATVGTGQIAALNLRGVGDYLAFYFGHEMGDVVWYMAVAFVLAKGSSWLTASVYQWLVMVCGILVLVLGVGFLYVAWRFMTGATRPEGATEAVNS